MMFSCARPARHRDRIARKRARLIDGAGRGDLLHKRTAAGIRADRHPAADDLAVGHEVGLHTEIFLCTAGREAETRDDLVENEQRTVFVAERTQSRQETLLGRNDAHVPPRQASR